MEGYPGGAGTFDPPPIPEIPMDEQGIEAFEPDIRDDTNSLIYLGRIEDSFHFCGHTFNMRTLYGDEELLAGLVCKEYAETWTQHKAWAWSLAALALTAVDGDQDFCPRQTRDPKAYAHARFNYCTSQWFWPVGNYLYNCYRSLEQRQAQVLSEVEDLSRGILPMSTPFAGSSIDKGDSQAEQEPTEDIMDLLTEPEDSTESI